MADTPYEQLGTWIFDGVPEQTVTVLQGIRDFVGDDVEVRFAQALEISRSRSTVGFDDAVAAAAESDAVVLVLGEESILSGEAHSRADISLPGAQEELVHTRQPRAGKPVIAVIMAGRPLTLGNVIDDIDAILYAWHPGTMGGPAIADLLFGVASPSGKLPVTFPRMVGQVPIYYNQKNTGHAATADNVVMLDDIPVRARQTSLGNKSYHLDAGFTPQFVFGYGLVLCRVRVRRQSHGQRNASCRTRRSTLTVSADVTNNGDVAAEEVVQLYARDLVGSVTRPVRELKGFRRVLVEPGQTVQGRLRTDIRKTLHSMAATTHRLSEPGEFPCLDRR